MFKEVIVFDSSKAKLKTILCAIVVGSVLAALLLALSMLVIPKNNQKAFGMTNEAANGIMGEPKDSIDVLFIGDSEAFSSFSPLQMWSEHGFTSYVCATIAQQLPLANTFLHRATLTQKPRVVVIETNTIYAPFTASDAILRTAQDFLPILEFHNRWKSLTEIDFTSQPTSTWSDDFKGFQINRNVTPADATNHMAPSDVSRELGDLNTSYLQAMIDYCREIGAEPLLVSTPSTVNWNTARHNGIKQFADQAGVTYIDLNVEPNKVDIDWKTDTRDKGDHLNLVGATKVTTYIGDYLVRAYNLSSHESDAAYHSWDESLARYQASIEEG